MKLLVATFNPGKQQEFKKIFAEIKNRCSPPIQLIFPSQLNLTDQAEEIGQTFCQNSALKARFFFKKSDLPTLADDGGLVIPALNGEPGVHSRRWLGRESSDEELINYALKRLKNFKTPQQRQAFLVTCLSYFDGQRLSQTTAKIKGFIAHQPSQQRTPGYPFRDLFIVLPLNKYYNQLTDEEHHRLNHRRRALLKLWEKLGFLR